MNQNMIHFPQSQGAGIYGETEETAEDKGEFFRLDKVSVKGCQTPRKS